MYFQYIFSLNTFLEPLAHGTDLDKFCNTDSLTNFSFGQSLFKTFHKRKHFVRAHSSQGQKNNPRKIKEGTKCTDTNDNELTYRQLRQTYAALRKISFLLYTEMGYFFLLWARCYTFSFLFHPRTFFCFLILHLRACMPLVTCKFCHIRDVNNTNLARNASSKINNVYRKKSSSVSPIYKNHYDTFLFY